MKHSGIKLNTRELIENSEETLSPHASKSRLSRGRIKPEKPCVLRTDFQRDRDRIIHSNSFRRLKHKTQVFISPLGDHYVTRLTHTLEVMQIARTISRALNLNEDLTEAIALGHDLGHTPFGHLGEDILNSLCPNGFKHNEQSLRVVDLLEKCGQGLNLTWEVRDGIVNHSKSNIGIFGEGWADVGTLEGEVVKVADIVAYINHDINDAIRAGVINNSDIPPAIINRIGCSSSQRINTLVLDIVNHTFEAMNNAETRRVCITMSPDLLNIANSLREFLFDKVYNSDLAIKDKDKAKEIVSVLFSYLSNHPDKLPDEYNYRNDAIESKVTDYIAGMTDQYAVLKASEISHKQFVFTKLL
jgi:dGTPase